MQSKPRATAEIAEATCEVLTPTELAKFLKIPPHRVYELTRFRAGSRGEPIPHRKIGRELRFIKREIQIWLLGLPQPQHLQKRAYHKKCASATGRVPIANVSGNRF
jgi:Helix-turn-helix domain